jgi:hypothetical protein
MMEERHTGNRPALVGFAIAFAFDVLDVVAHIVVVLGLLHHHFHVGLHVPHALLHGVEGAGIAIAMVSTAAAAVAEMLAMRRSMPVAAAAPASGKGFSGVPATAPLPHDGALGASPGSRTAALAAAALAAMPGCASWRKGGSSSGGGSSMHAPETVQRHGPGAVMTAGWHEASESQEQQQRQQQVP